MNGVEVLASNEVVVEYAYNFKMFWISFVVLSLIVSCILNYSAYENVKDFIINLVLSTLLGLVFGLISGAIFQSPCKYETEYKVVISDEVSLNEFNENYEIISQEEKIYTVRERN